MPEKCQIELVMHFRASDMCTYSIDENAGQDQVEHIEHGASPDPGMMIKSMM